jgi:hypothetical protein
VLKGIFYWLIFCKENESKIKFETVVAKEYNLEFVVCFYYCNYNSFKNIFLQASVLKICMNNLSYENIA